MRFEAAREDGRTYSQVIIDLVRDANPGTQFSYDDICNALTDGSPRKFRKQDAVGVVLRANKKLIRLHNRTLRNVFGHGYKVAHAHEHMDLAENRKIKADRQLEWALDLLNHVDWNGLDENQRMAHMGQLALTSALFTQQRALEARLAKLEKATKAISGNKSS